jgi:hypothetical protein
MSLTDKEMAIMFKADAGQYMIAAENLRIDEHSIHLVAPTYFLRSHAIELLLKACLLANGWTVDECWRKLKHRLDDAMREAEKVGLVLSESTRAVIRTLSPCHSNYVFRYSSKSNAPYTFPNAGMTTEALAELFDQVHKIVADKCELYGPLRT